MTWDEFSEALIRLVTKNRKFEVPVNKIKNRLAKLRMGEFLLDGPNPIERDGFPFFFVEYIDEAILAMANFLTRFLYEGGTLNVLAINRIPLGAEKNLAFWRTNKARLYVEMQNLILLIGRDTFAKGSGRSYESTIKRIFVFRDISDFAYLDQSAINVLSELTDLGMELGFAFSDKIGLQSTFEMHSQDSLAIQVKMDRDVFEDPAILLNSLILELVPERRAEDRHHDFYVLSNRVVSNESELPYSTSCRAQWFKTRDEAFEYDKSTLLRYVLFNNSDENWAKLEDKKFDRVSRMCNEFGAFFKNSIISLYDAFVAHCPRPSKKQQADFCSRLNRIVLTNDFIRLERAMSYIARGDDIVAIDPTSVKRTIALHDSISSYRHWMRKSLSRVIDNPESKLTRIYILKDQSPSGKFDDELRIFRGQMQYYLDYCNYRLPKAGALLFEGIDKPKSLDEPEWFLEKRKSLAERLKVYVTTDKALSRFKKEVSAHLEKNQMKEFLGQLFGTGDRINDAKVIELLCKLDLLITKGMVYNFTTESADPSELEFDAYIYRCDGRFSTDDDFETLFDLPKQLTDGNERFFALHRLERLRALVESLGQYLDGHKRIIGAIPELTAERELIWSEIDEVKELIDSFNKMEDEQKIGEMEKTYRSLLERRRNIEVHLFNYVEPRLRSLFDSLKKYSIEVEFFGRSQLAAEVVTQIQEVRPFDDCQTMKDLTTKVTEHIGRVITGNDSGEFQPVRRISEVNDGRVDNLVPTHRGKGSLEPPPTID